MEYKHQSLFIALLVLSVSCLSAEPPGPDPAKLQAFNTIYAEYKQLIQEKKFEEALGKSHVAFELGKEIFGDADQNTAALAFNHGRLLSQLGDYAKAAYILTEATAIFERVYGVEAPELIPVLEAYGKNASLMGLRMPDVQKEHYGIVRRALDIQRRNQPEDRIAHAALLVRIAPYLYKIQPGNTETAELLRETLKNEEAAYGKDALELIPVLMALGNVSGMPFKPTQQEMYYDRALKIAQVQSPEDKIKYADLSLEAGRNVLQFSKSKKARPFLETAYQHYMDQFGAGHLSTALACLALGEFHSAKRDYEKAEEYLLGSLETFTSDPAYRTPEIRARTVLTGMYEYWNKREMATEQILAISKISSGTSTQEMIPVYRVNPDYPTEALSKGSDGWVMLDFTVDETGQVCDVVVEDSEGHPLFKDAATAAINKWRYVPRFENGKPVATPHLKAKLTFDVEG
ncbi:MAG: TonB family protein [Gammaproteobacteria bacterium]|nr:MAG: TonB family protein [Gammaproteobacteria bacterium]